MPFVVHPRVRSRFRRLATLTAIGAMATSSAALATAGTAAAATPGNCPNPPTSTPFARWGDSNQYFLMQGGSFEGFSLSGWSLFGARVSGGNEPFNVASLLDRQSLQIFPGGSVYSPTFCLDNTMPFFRFFVHQLSAGSDLKISLVIKDGADQAGQTVDTITTLADGSTSSWAPTAQLPLASVLSIPAGSSVQAQLHFEAAGQSGNWQLDDVFVDPYRSA